MSTGGQLQVGQRGGRELRKYWVAGLCLLEQRPQAPSPGGIHRQPWEEAGGFGTQSLTVDQGCDAT